MSRLSRFLPKFMRSGKENRQTGDKSQCRILFLDETQYYVPFKGSLKGQYLLDKALEQLNLLEKDYFGLRFVDNTGQTHWLDAVKSLSSQVKGCTLPYTFYFCVKFYLADPCRLKEEITRYQFFLQVKSDILHNRLPVTFEEAAELFAYAVQSELGDYESQHLPAGYVSEFQFVHDQTEELEAEIANRHQKLGGTVPATAELKFLDKVKWLDMYGVDLHPVLGEGNTEYSLGITPTGIVVLKNKTKVGNYFWPRITKVNYKTNKVFVIRVRDKTSDEHTYAFELRTKAACKHLWKCCIEHQNFFRMYQFTSAPSSSKPFRSTAKHRNSGRYDRQNNSEQQTREQPHVMRVQSRRQARRALSDTRLNQGDTNTGIQFTDGHVTMVVKPERARGSRHRSLPDLKGRESPTSTRSAPWESNVDAGLYTPGRDSPISVTQSENINHARRYHRDSDSEHGNRKNRSYRGYDSDGGSSRHKYFPSSRKGSDNESDASFSRRRREAESGSESEMSHKYSSRQRKTKSVGQDWYDREMKANMQNIYLGDKENRQNGSAPSLHSAPAGDLRQKKMRRRRSKSPGNSKRPPEELKKYIEFDYLEPTEEFTQDQLKEIPYVNVETKAEPFKVKYSPSNRRRYRSPKRKSAGDLDVGVKTGYQSEDPPPSFSSTTDRRQVPDTRQNTPGYYSDTGSLSRRNHPVSPYTQSKFNNATLPHTKPLTTDIRSIAQFHENPLFYDHPLSLPGYHGYPTFHPSVRNHRYNPPPTAVFKPIDVTDSYQNSPRVDTSHGQVYPSSHMNGTGNPMHVTRGDDLHTEQVANGQGQGHNYEDDDRNHDSGLNSSHSSSQGPGMTPNLSLNAGRRMYGTKDAITRLYSSPGGTRRQFNHNMDQSNPSTNQNSPYNRNMRPTNQNSNQSNAPSNENSAYNRLNVRPSNQGRGYNNQSNTPNQPMMTSQSNTPNRGHTNSSQHSANFNSNQNRNGPYYDSRSQGVNSDYDNPYGGIQSQDYTQEDHARRNMQNGYIDNSWQNTGSPRTYNSDMGHQSRSMSRSNAQYSESSNQQASSQPTITYDSFGYATINHSNKGPPPLPQRHGMSPQKQDPYGTQVGSYGGHGESQAGHQPWQYVSNGRRQNMTPGSSTHQQMQQNSGKVERSPSPYSRSPASSPIKAKQQGTSTLSTNENTASSHVTPKFYKSPDKVTNNQSIQRTMHQSNIMSALQSSPRKPGQPEVKGDSIGHGRHSYSRQRAPAFGQSDIWTEL